MAENSKHSEENTDERKELLKIIAAGLLFIAAVVIDSVYKKHGFAIPVYLVSYLIVSFDVLKEAFENIKSKELFDESFLMAVASIGAIILGDFREAAVVMLLFAIGERIEEAAEEKSRRSIGELMDIKPDTAHLIVGEDIKTLHPERVNAGDTIVIRPGEKIPLDGVITEGESFADTSALTGESVPRRITVGDEVISGCINTEGVIKVKVTKEYSESTVNRILELVENASETKSTQEKFITKFSKVYTPTVCILALLLAVIPSLITGDWRVWIYRALTFLVISCPCALVISVPMSFFGGIGAASRKGILVKGSNYLEALDDMETAVFDKTGTLTKGVFEVKKTVSKGITHLELLRLAAFAEGFSSHPIAKSIVEAYEGEIDYDKIGAYKEIMGQGVFANVEDKNILVGNEKLMHEYGIEFEPVNEAGTVCYFAMDEKYIGYILIADKLKEDAKTAIDELKSFGVSEFVMLTGDNQVIADAVGEELGMTEVHGGMMPTDKVDRVRELLKREGRKGQLVFTGDGINDAPVIAIADVGVAMGGLGSDAAIEAADVVLMTDEPGKLAEAVRIAKRTVSIAKQNIVFAIGVKVLVLVLGAVGVAAAWMAVFADVGVMLICVLNSLRNLR